MNLFILFVFLIFIQNVKNAEEIHTGYHGIVHVFEDDFTFELSFSNDGKDKRIENHMLISHSQHNASGGITIQLMTCEANAHFDLMLAKDISLKKCEQKLDMPLGKCNQIMVELNQKRQEAHTQSDSLSSFREDAQRKMENLSSAEIYGRKLSILLLDEYCRSLKAIHDQLIVKFMDEQNNKATLEELSRLQVQLEQSSSESQSKRQKLEKLVQKLRSENARLERELRLIEHGRRNREPMEDMESQDRRSDRIQENGENVRSDNQTGHKPINGKMIQNPQGHVMQQPEAQISNNEEAELNKLFTDVMDIFNNHVTGNNAQTVERDGNKAEFAENRWHRMYEAVYEELKKVRLHEWNGKFKEQMRLVVLGNGNLKEKYKQNFADLRKVLEERGMVIFERDLECVAAAGEIKDLMLGGRKFMVERNHHGIESTELPLQISKLSKFQLALEQARSENPTLFIAVEFFNLELQTSRLVNEPEANFDFTAVFELTVSDLFIHYLQTESIKMELYIINNGLNYELWSEAKIPLRKLLFAQTPMQFRGELIFSAISNDAEKEQKQHPVMTQLAYIVKVPFSLLYALAMQRQKMTANTFILLGSENVYEDTNELIIQIHRCVGLDKLKSIHDQNGLSLPTTYVAYDFFRFSMHMSKLVAQSRTRIFGESQTWRLPAGSEAIHKYLLEEDLLIFVIEEDSNATENKQIGQFRSHALDHISLPLFPLSQNQKIRGSLPLADRVYESIASGLSIEVAFVFEDKENGISEWLRDKLIHINTLILSMVNWNNKIKLMLFP